MHPEAGQDRGRDGLRRPAQLRAGRREPDRQRALVPRVPVPGDDAALLEALEQRRQRRRLEADPRGELRDPQRRALPQREHHEVLRVGQPERLQERPVHGDHLAGGDRQGEAHLTVEGEEVHRGVVPIVVGRGVGAHGSEATRAGGYRSCTNYRRRPLRHSGPRGPDHRPTDDEGAA